MTIEEAIECSAEELKRMTEDELLKHFGQYLNVTRPELAPRPKKSTAPAPVDFAMRQKLAKLQELGIDVDFMKKGKRR